MAVLGHRVARTIFVTGLGLYSWCPGHPGARCRTRHQQCYPNYARLSVPEGTTSTMDSDVERLG